MDWTQAPAMKIGDVMYFYPPSPFPDDTILGRIYRTTPNGTPRRGVVVAVATADSFESK